LCWTGVLIASTVGVAPGRGPQNQLRRLAGMTVSLRFVMTDADLYSLRFR
jgi:hypothetical protein